MQTLTAELVAENLLFIVEVTQYKQKIIKKIIKLRDGVRKSPVSLSHTNNSSKEERGFPNIINPPNLPSVSKTEPSISSQVTIQQFSTKTGTVCIIIDSCIFQYCFYLFYIYIIIKE